MADNAKPTIPCRCGGETQLQYLDETTGGVVVERVPVLVCQRCGEQWYPPGVPRLLEGLREAVASRGEVRVEAHPATMAGA